MSQLIKHRRIAAVSILFFLMMGGTLSAQSRQRSPAEVQADIENLKGRVDAELSRVKSYLTYYDQLQRMQVAQGGLQPGDAAARTKGKGQELYNNSFEDVEFQQLLVQHREAAQAYFNRIEQEVAAARQWPNDKPAETYLAMSRMLLDRARREYEANIAAGQDPRSSLAQATEILAWTSGQPTLPDGADPFAGQFKRISCAVPDERMRGRMVDSETRTTLNPAAAPGPVVAGYTQPQQPVNPMQPGVNTPPIINPTGMPPNIGNPPGGVIYPPAGAGDPQAFTRAHAFYTAGRFREALPDYNAAVASMPGHRDALFERAVVRTWLNDLAGARGDFGTLVARDHGDIESRRLYAIAQLVTGDPWGGKQAADALLATQPNNPAFLLVAAEAALSNNDAQTAQLLLTRAKQVSPDAATSLYAEAGRFLEAGVPAIALLQFSTVLWMGPEWGVAYFGIGASYTRLGVNDRAIDAYQRYLQMDQTSPSAQTARQEIERLRQANR